MSETNNKLQLVIITMCCVILLEVFSKNAHAQAQVTRDIRETCRDLTGTFTSCDYRETSAAMKRMSYQVQEMNWWERFKRSVHWVEYKKRGMKKPIIMIGTITDKTGEGLFTDEFTQELKMEMINQNKGVFVIESSDQEVTNLINQCEKYSDPRKCPKIKGATPGHFLIKGRVTLLQQRARNQQTRRYRTTLELIHLQSREIFWTDYHTIDKSIVAHQGSSSITLKDLPPITF